MKHFFGWVQGRSLNLTQDVFALLICGVGPCCESPPLAFCLLRHSFPSVPGKPAVLMLLFCLHELPCHYLGCFHSQNHLLFLKECLSTSLLISDHLQSPAPGSDPQNSCSRRQGSGMALGWLCCNVRDSLGACSTLPPSLSNLFLPSATHQVLSNHTVCICFSS